MRRWLHAAGPALEVADRPETWIPGALAWLASVGWVPLLVAVVEPPNVGDLTVWGAGLQQSGAWPWNLAFLALGLALLVLAAFVLVALGTAALRARIEGAAVDVATVGRQLAIALVAGAPAVLGVAVVLVGVGAVAVAEVQRADSTVDPIVRILGRVAPLIAFAVLLAVVGTAIAAVAGRESIARGSAADALGGTPARLRALGGPGILHLAVSVATTAVALAVFALLLGVLWAPVGARLATVNGPDTVTGLLLVGFVAIWLCTVLGGGALHAWSTATWSRLLDAEPRAGRGAPEAAWRP
jgi:hypothetical protein